MKIDWSENKDLVIVRGIVVPVAWDPAGNVVGIGISTITEDEYRVDDNDKGRELRKFMQKEVDVWGVVKEEETFSKEITVTSFCSRRLDEAITAAGGCD